MGSHPVILTSPMHEENCKENWSTREELNGFIYYRTRPTRQLPGPVTNEALSMQVLS
jgi:hypothetical protein